MLKFLAKVVVSAAADQFAGLLETITTITSGATVDKAEGYIEAGCDDVAALLAVLPPEVKIVTGSDTLLIRVTAPTDTQRVLWTARIAAELEGAEIKCTQEGYWAPTAEYEPSWVITSPYKFIKPAVWRIILDWMTDTDTQAVYYELGGEIIILDREEVEVVVKTGATLVV